jgi:hypothetical protein
MDANAKRELAHAIRATINIHESSYSFPRDRYAMNWTAAAEQATLDKDLVDLVVVLCMSGFSDVPEWAERQLAQKQAA